MQTSTPLSRVQVRDALLAAGRILQAWTTDEHEFQHQAKAQNPWFTLEFQHQAFATMATMLATEALDGWLAQYPEPVAKPKIIGLVMAGNLPLVGLHDLLCIIAAGHLAQAKTSSQDDVLPKRFVQDWVAACPWLEGRIVFVDRLQGFDAVIATGSSNTSRYFEHYFGKYPSIIRKNRSSVALLTGEESDEDLSALADDVFLYFGFGCRSVSSLLLPKEYDLAKLAQAFARYESLGFHNKFANNLDYHRALYLLNQEPFYDLGGVLLRPSETLHSPGAVVNLIYYKDLDEARRFIDTNRAELQVIVSKEGVLNGAAPFGTSQMPTLGDYADGIDTMQFLHSFPA